MGQGSGSGSSNNASHIMDGDALSLTGKSKGKAKRKKDGKKNFDVSKVKCFTCHKKGHFASQCPNKKKKSNTQMVGSAEVDGFSRNFDEELCLIACMASTTGKNIWYINSGASSHMTGQKRFFKDLQEGGTGIHVELGGDVRYQAQGVGTVSFERESSKPLSFVDVLYIPGLTKNLISISTLEEKGYQVKFRDHRVYIRPKGSNRSLDWVIGRRSEKVYKLHFEPTKALVNNSNSS